VKTLLVLAIDQCHDLVDAERRIFLMAADLGQDLVNNPRVPPTGMAAKTAKGLSRYTPTMHILWLVETAQQDVAWENEDFAQLVGGRVLTFVDGHGLLRRGGRDTDLAGASLRGAQLQGADLSETNLEDADLQGADLERANLKGARLIGANLQGCNLTRANLYAAQLGKADLRRANLRHAELRQTHWAGTALRGADLWAANLWGVDLSNAFVDGADLSRADTRGS